MSFNFFFTSLQKMSFTMTFSYTSVFVFCSCPVSLHSWYVWILSWLLALLLMVMSAPCGKGSCLSGLFMFTNICVLGTHSQSIFAEGMRRRWTPVVGGLSAQGRRNKSLSLAKSRWTMRLLRSPPSSTFSGRTQALHFVTFCGLAGVSLLWPVISGKLGCGYVPESKALPWIYAVGARNREMCREAPVSSWWSRPRAEFNLSPSPSLVVNRKRTLLEHRFLGRHFDCTFCVTGAWETVFQWLPVVSMLLAQ